MPRRKYESSGQDESTETEVVTAPVPTPPEAPTTMKLRLKENHYVHGEFVKGGTIVEFPKAEAEKRLKRTQLWELV